MSLIVTHCPFNESCRESTTELFCECIEPILMFQGRLFSVWPSCEPLWAVSQVNGDRRCQIRHFCAAFCHRMTHPRFFFSVCLLAGQRGTHRRGWLRTWRCHIMWGSSSPKSSAVWTWKIWSRRWRMIIFQTYATTAGKRNNKVCFPLKTNYSYLCI